MKSKRRISNPWLALARVLLCAALVAVPARAMAAAEQLTLEKALTRAIANNKELQSARLGLRGQELTYDNAWDTMFMPAISLGFNSSSAVTVGHIPGPTQTGLGTSADTYGHPSSQLALQLGSYTLFNFWKDWNIYKSAQMDWSRAQEQFQETVRRFRFQVMVAYYSYNAQLEKVDAAQRSVSMSEALLELQRAKRRNSKATDRDVESSSIDVLNAKNEYNQAYTTARGLLWSLNQLLGDSIDTEYQLFDKVRYQPLRLAYRDALKLYYDHSPSQKDRVLAVRKAEMSLDNAQKNRLPLPKVALSGVTLGYTNGYYGTVPNGLSNGNGTGTFDVSGSISFSVPLLGPGGIFGSRTVEQARIALEQADLGQVTTTYGDQVSLHGLIQQILQAQLTIANSQEQFKSASAVLDGVFKQSMAGSVGRLELKDALNQARTSELSLTDALVSHLSLKLELAKLIGVDKIPGDN